MQRQPPHFRPRGGGGCGRGPAPFPQQQSQFSSPISNYHRPQNPNSTNFPINFPVQSPNFVNFPLQNPNLVNFPYQNSGHVNFQFPFQQQQSSVRPHNEAVERANRAVLKARHALLAAGESVTVWKVSQAALLELQANSWEALGFSMQQVPSLHSLIDIEGKVNALIHCFVAVRKICSLCDVEVALCESEGVERFEDLELGPFTRYPLVVHYFSLSSDTKKAFRIRSEEIIKYLHEFWKSLQGKEVKVDEFLDYVAKKCSVACKEKLNVRIQDLRMHLSYLRNASLSESEVLEKLKGLKKNKKLKIRPLLSSQKKQMDEQFQMLTDRMKSFSSIKSEFCGKHIRFASSSSEDEDGYSEDSDDDSGDEYEDNDGEHEERSHCKATSSNVKCSDRVNSCPYPSAVEERTRLGLKSKVNGSARDRSSSESSKRKRRSGSLSHGLVDLDVSGKDLSSGLDLRKKRARYDDGTREKLIKNEGKLKKAKTKKRHTSDNAINEGLSVSNDSMRLFIATWKEACQQNDVEEVFDRMLDFYKSIKRNKVKVIFSLYPFIGLLNIAVASIKYGMWDTMYDSLSALSQHGGVQTEMCDAGLSIEDEEGDHNVPASVEKTLLSKCVFTSDDVINKITAFFDADRETSNISSCKVRRLDFFRMLCNCQSWLNKQFGVDDFESLGFGDFLKFLERYMHLLPDVLQKCIMGETGEELPLQVCIEQLQMGVLISQASVNVWANEDISKQKILELLRLQFPLISFNVVKSDSTTSYQEKLSKSGATCDCILFSAALAGMPYAGGITTQTEIRDSETIALSHKTGDLGTPTTKEAIEVLLRAPMLTDLESWLHWELMFAPSLGPLVAWLLNEVKTEEFLCLVTRGGKVIRINHLATMDSFLEVLLRGSSFETAVQLLSLFAIYGGEQHVPTSLLKCHIQRAFEVFRTNVMEIEANNDKNRSMPGKTSHTQHVVNDGTCVNYNTEWNKNCSSINKLVPVLARFVVDCLSYLPLEFCSYVAKLFLGGLQSFVKDAPSAILLECKRIEQRIILHEVGMALGIVEWINDYKTICSLEDSNSLISSNLSYLFASSLEFGADPKAACILSDKNLLEDKMMFSKEADQDGKGRDKASDTISVPDLSSNFLPGNPDWNLSSHDKYSDPVKVIEAIRREEFGLDPSLSDTESRMMRKQHARLGRALHCLSQELYSQDSHFLLELVQNADDNVYPEEVEPTLTFILLDKSIIVLNNEQGFSAENVKALCDVGNSTKKGHSAGYIGKKGIGFKSVFRITDAPEIHSNGFHIKFDITEGQIGFVLPTIISPCDMEFYSRLVSTNTIQMGQNCWKTCIVLPFSSNLSGGVALNNILSMFSDLHPSLLLFLHRLKCIKFRNMLSDSSVIMRKEVVGDGLVKVFLGEEKVTWLVVSQKMQANVIRSDVQTTEISIAFTLDETEEGEYIPHLDQQPVFAYLPLRKYGLKFILQGDFALPSSREEVVGDSPWNQWLLSEFPSLFVAAQRSFCDLPCFKRSPGKAVAAYMSFVPLVGEVHGFFSCLPRMIISKLRLSNCLLLDGDSHEWVPPCKVIRNWTEQARALLPDSLLREHLGLGFMNKDIIVSDSIAKSLGIEEYGPKLLFQIISSLCCSEDGLNRMGFGWLSAWLSAFYGLTLNTGTGTDLITNLRKLPFIPLSNGKYGSLDDGIIWLHCDTIHPGIDQEYGSEAFPKLYSQLRTVNPALYTAAAAVDISGSDGSLTENVTRMLLRAGVQRLSAHDIVKDHILPAISDNRYTQGNKDLMTEYLAFSMFHLNSSCPCCRLEKEYIIAELHGKAFILTNLGYKRPAEVPIHFSKDFGNPYDIKKLTSGLELQWHEVDITYLEHPISKSVSGGMFKWRTFLQELGVTDFVQIVQVEKSIANMPYDIQKSIMEGQGMISMDSIVNDWESEEWSCLLSQLSSRGDKEKSRYLLEILDALWDDCFGNKVSGYCLVSLTGESKLFRSSLVRILTEAQWMVSSMDDELHYPRDLFHYCEAVQSVVGDIAPYTVPKVKNAKLLKDIGLKTEVALEDTLCILKIWKKSEVPFKASISQMSKFYNFIWHEMPTSKQKVLEELKSGPFIFVPYDCDLHKEVVLGEFLSPEEVYWHDSTAAMDHMPASFPGPLRNGTDLSSSKMLSHVYPKLHGFFVNECGVPEAPSLRSYLQVLLQLSEIALPSQSAKTVFQIFCKWTDGLKFGSLTSEDVGFLKASLMKKECPVLPTTQDKWVSLNSFYGLTCFSDDDNLKKEFKHHEKIDFLYFGELTDEEKEIRDTKFPLLMQSLGVLCLSQVVTREAIYCGHADNSFKILLVNWALPYAQRYIYSAHSDQYFQLKQSGFVNLENTQIVVVEKLFYKNIIKNFEIASKKRYECSSLLQDNILYITRESDSHSIFLELSRLFFGEPQLHLANFLHMITTMVESGAPEEQMEFFITNSQKVPKIPAGEPVWALSSAVSVTGNNEIQRTDCVSPDIDEADQLKSMRLPGGNSNWPPATWRTAPGLSSTNSTVLKTQVANNLQRENGDTESEDRPSTNPSDLTQFSLEEKVEINQGTCISLTTTKGSRATMEIEPNPGRNAVTSADVVLDSVDSVTASDVSDSTVGNLNEREQLSFGTINMQQALLTGRTGEHVAYEYFVERVGDKMVKWVNEAAETGLPYDLIVGDNEMNREYIEVKSTKSAKKDWFYISPREWQFAIERGEFFSIAYVVLSGEAHVITVYKNPARLSQLGQLRLAMVIPKQQQGTSNPLRLQY